MADSAFHVEMRSDSLILESQSDATTRRDEHDAASVNSHQRFGMEQRANPGRVEQIHGVDMNRHVASGQFDGSHRIDQPDGTGRIERPDQTNHDPLVGALVHRNPAVA
jgi:hypothetical protein